MAAPTITYNGVEIRNTAQQILENKEQIERHWDVDRVIAEFGITVLGRLNTAEPYLTDPESPDYFVGEHYGDAYTVGAEAQEKYQIYVWTRANPKIGETADYWLYIGYMTIQGPPGPAGKSISNVSLNSNNQLVFTFSDGSTLTLAESIKGDPGKDGKDGKTPSIIATQETNGARISTYSGDGNLTNTVYISNGQPGQSIEGPQGIPGRGLNILGTFTSTSQFPTAATAEMGDACILQSGGTTTLYMLTGTPGTPSTYAWAETSFGGGTEITVSGNVQSTWNADTKLDKVSNNANYTRLYAINRDGTQTTVQYADTALAGFIPLRLTSGQLAVPQTPSASNHATSKNYVDSIRSTLQDQVNDLDVRVATIESSGGGGSSSGGGGWNVITTSEGVPLTFNPTSSSFYEVMLYSEHGMGDNAFASNVFLFRADVMYAYATSAIIPVGALGVNIADLSFYWKLEHNYTEFGDEFIFTPIYNADPSTIHNMKLYYKEV